MPNIEQIERLRSAAQGVIDERDFNEVKTEIEAITAEATGVDEWIKIRMGTFVMASAFGHMCGARQIKKTATEPALEVPDSLPSLTRYAAMTSELDKVATPEVIGELTTTGPQLATAFNYFVEQCDLRRAFETEHPERVWRHGFAVGLMQPNEILTGQVIGNAQVNVTAHMVREAMRICMHEGTLPPNDELAHKLRVTLSELASITRTSTQQFRGIIFGARLARQHIKQPQDRLQLPKWHDIVRTQVEAGAIPREYIIEIGRKLRVDAATEFGRVMSIRNLGLCAAQIALRAQEPKYSIRRFADRGIKLPNGEYSLAEYQLLRAIDAAEQTIFADPIYRLAMQTIANMLHEADESASQ